MERDHGEKSQKQLPSLPVNAGWIFLRPRSVEIQNFDTAAHKHNLFPKHLKTHLKTSNLSADNLKKKLDLDGSIPEPAMRAANTGQQIPCFNSRQLLKTWMCNIRLHLGYPTS